MAHKLWIRPWLLWPWQVEGSGVISDDRALLSGPGARREINLSVLLLTLYQTHTAFPAQLCVQSVIQ